ncbi:MAG: hypothetical protein RBU27_12955 [Bacteroidota bacterium]|jgi:hypothetical protein|nr:hypothetical protein [Bacteroidota bacterium]
MRTVHEIQDSLRSGAAVVLELSDEEIDSLTARDIELLQAEFGSRVLMTLPPRERAFMTWLKTEDAGVYADLWEDDEELLVSLSFLPTLRADGPGFAICELASHDNYYFTSKHVKPTGLEAMPGILARAEQGEELAVGEVLMFEILRAPIDLWHFCYRYGVPLNTARAAVRELAAHDWIVHLRKREELMPYLEDTE